MTDIAHDELADRLARLQARRSASGGGSATPAPASTEPNHPDVRVPTTDSPRGRASVGPSRRRRSPAATAKIVTIGASTTALLGLIAAYGYAEARPEGPQLVDAGATGSPTATDVAPVAPAAETTPPDPNIIVVLVDASTGERLASASAPTRDAALDQALAAASIGPGRNAPAPDDATPEPTSVVLDESAPTPDIVVADPAPVAAPTAVDVAVPVPPPPPAPPARAAAPPAAPAPTVQATSSGS